MDRKTFIRELEFLLQDISDDERKEALSFYEDYFDEAGVENESQVIQELGDPSKVAAIIKDSLKGNFEEHIHSGDHGFSNDDYQRNFEVVDVDTKEKHSSLKNKWNELASRDRFLLIVLIILAIVPLSGAIGSFFGFGFTIAAVLFCLIFGFWIITFVLSIIAIIFIVVGVMHLFTLPGAGLIYMGIGCLLIALATIFEKIASWFFKQCIPQVIDGISSLFHKIFHNRGVQS